MSQAKKAGLPKSRLSPVQSQWGERPDDYFGYSSDEERRLKRGLEDWELVESIPESQMQVPKWFIAVVVVVLLVAIGLSFPFWGDRVGYEREWFNWGFVAAIVYIGVGAAFVYMMVRMYGSKMAGRLDWDKTAEKTPPEEKNKASQR